MDQMEYMLHGPQRLATVSEPIHGSPGSWMSHGHPPMHSAPWASHSPLPQLYHHQRPHQFNSHPFPLGPNSGLPLPDPSFRGLPPLDPLSGLPVHPRPWGHHFPPMPGPMPPPMPPNHMNMHGAPSELPFGLLPVGNRGLSMQPPVAELGMGPAGATSEPHSLPPRPMFPPSAEHSVNSLGQQIAASHFSVSPPQANPTPSRRVSHHNSSNASRPPRAAIPGPSFTPLPYHHEVSGIQSSHRRSGHSRARRSMNNRVTMSDSSRDGDDEFGNAGHEWRPTGINHRASQSLSEEPALRQMQVLRGAVSSKMVVSRSALQSLVSVKIEDLGENDRTCVICYNEYGVETPEGHSEAPLQLPKCKHVFGDYCIKKWFEDSDSCPYCRDKLHAEPKHHLTANSTRAFLNMMRIRGPIPPGLPEEIYLQYLSGLTPDESLVDMAGRHPLATTAAERRSAPDDAGEGQRRTRPRRSSQGRESTTPERESPGSSGSSPIRIPLQEHAPRQGHWNSRPGEYRGLYASQTQGRQGPRSRYPVGAAMTNIGLDASHQNPAQESMNDGFNGSGTSRSVVEGESSTDSDGSADIPQEQQTASVAISSDHPSRNRPW